MATGVELATAWVRLVPTVEGIQGAITQEVSGANSGMASAGDEAGKKYGRGFKSAASGLIATAGALFLAKGISDFVSTSLTSLARIETINAQTAQVIESTGGAANVSAKHVEALAGSLEALTATEAESVQEGANMLLTFKNIQNGVGEGNQIFDDATTALVDMSRAMGSDPKTAAIQLGKALNDPIAGISALSRVGIQFTDDQKALIESLVESGQTMEAQKIILGELNSQFGGSGAAYAETYQGQLDLLGHSFGTLGETIVGAAMPAVQGFIGVLVPAFDWLAANQPVLVAIATAIGVTLVAAFIAWTASIWASTIALLANPVTWIILGIMALIAAVILLVMNWDQVVKWITDVWSGFISWITGVINGFVGWWNQTWSTIGKFVSDVWNRWIVTPIRSAWDWIVGAVQTGLSTIDRVWRSIWDGLGAVVRGVWNGILGWIEGGINGAIDLINGMINGVNVIGGVVGISIATIPHVSLPRLAQGATVLPRPGGTAAILAEAGRPESIVDTGLMNRALEDGLAGNAGTSGPAVFNLFDTDGVLIGTIRGEIARDGRDRRTALRSGLQKG